jgi:hypothetical protein
MKLNLRDWLSWGERSCKSYGDCGISGINSCDTTCILYEWNGKTPDTQKVKALIGNHPTMCYPTREGYKTLLGLKELSTKKEGV